jgi:hypothetical protein
LLAKLQERRGPQQNPQIQLIKEEPHGVDPRVIVITRGGIVKGEDRVIQGKTIDESGVKKSTEKTQVFDPNKESDEARK